MGLFDKYIGGSLINIVVGIVWFGLKFVFIFCVGDEYMGCFIVE